MGQCTSLNKVGRHVGIINALPPPSQWDNQQTVLFVKNKNFRNIGFLFILGICSNLAFSFKKLQSLERAENSAILSFKIKNP